MKFKNHYNSIPEAGEVNELASETVPDQSLSVKDILERYARGLPLQGRIPVWQSDPDDDLQFDNWEHLDLAEREELINTYRSELNQIAFRRKRELAEQKKKKLDKDVDDLVRKKEQAIAARKKSLGSDEEGQEA